MNLLRNFLLAMTVAPVVIVAGCNGGGSAGSTSSTSSTTSTQPTQPATTTSNLAISSPVSGTSVSSPFTLAATATTCDSQTVTSIGYLLDSASTYTTANGTALSAQVTAAAGAHTVNIVAYGNSGATCNASTTITVTAPATGSDLAISSPTSGATVASPFTLKASATTCNGQSITSIGYSVDTGSTTVLTGGSIDASVTAAAGAHTVYVKAWGSSGAECDANVAITVSAPATTTTTTSSSPVPSTAISVNNIEELSTWKDNHDPATGSTSSGTMSMVSAPSPLSTLSSTARQFNTSYTGSGGEIYYVSWGADTTPMNFFWDGWVYINSSISSVANLELDMNQVISNGDTIIYGFQCDGYSGTWDYTENAGTVTATSAHWLHSSAACDVRSWTQNTWHHIQIYYSRNSNGNVTYHSVWLDGDEAQINETVPSAFGLGWGTTLLTNFQIDGLGTGSNTVYLDNLTISRW